MTDDLPQRLSENLEEAFPDVVAAYQHAVFTTALRMSGRREDAADVAAEAFLRAYTALRRVLHTSADRAVLLVTHSLEHALDLCDELIVLHRGRVGHVCALGGQTLPEVRRLYDAITAPRAE